MGDSAGAGAGPLGIVDRQSRVTSSRPYARITLGNTPRLPDNAAQLRLFGPVGKQQQEVGNADVAVFVQVTETEWRTRIGAGAALVEVARLVGGLGMSHVE